MNAVSGGRVGLGGGNAKSKKKTDIKDILG